MKSHRVPDSGETFEQRVVSFKPISGGVTEREVLSRALRPTELDLSQVFSGDIMVDTPFRQILEQGRVLERVLGYQLKCSTFFSLRDLTSWRILRSAQSATRARGYWR